MAKPTSDAQLCADGAGGALVVAGEHDDVDPQPPEGGYRLGAGRLGGVGHSHQAKHPVLVGKVEGGLALGGQLLGPCGEGAQLHPGLLHHGAVAAHAGAVSQGGPDAPAVDGGEPAH